MDKREEALREALKNNAAETQRWEAYQEENRQAIANLEAFSKQLEVDVMVPIGRKALVAGKLIHTNEVLVSHYQGYFSKCAAHKAKEICEQRLRVAKKNLEKLKTEAELWTNKLEKPYLEGVMPSAEQHEIIEDYDEEKEGLWREMHRLRLKEAKMREREKRETEMHGLTKNSNASDDIKRMLEEAELVEELNIESKEDEEENEDEKAKTEQTLQKLLSGEVLLPPPKPRIAHTPRQEEAIKLEIKARQIDAESKSNRQISAEFAQTTSNYDNNNNHIINISNTNDDDEDIDDDELPAETQLIEEHAKYLPASDQIIFYQYHLQIIAKKLLTSSISNAAEIEQKLRLFKVRERLEELLELAEEEEDDAEETATNDKAFHATNDVTAATTKTPIITNSNTSLSSQTNKRISFALQDETLEFRGNETVSEMLPKIMMTPTNPKRDIIHLNETEKCQEVVEKLENSGQSPHIAVDKKELILNKVAQNLEYVAEQQSMQDFDLVNKIIAEADCAQCHTLHIHFKHSTQSPSAAAQETTEHSFPGTPAELYRLVSPNWTATAKEEEEKIKTKTIFLDAYEGEEEVKVPALKEKDRPEAYKDLRMEFSNPALMSSRLDKEDISSAETALTKSILKNKNAVQTEIHLKQTNKKSNKNIKKTKTSSSSSKKPINEEEYMSAYNKVMSDVIEKKPITEPDPLPAERYIDALAPKKRISRFKQMRTEVETI